MAIIRKIIRLNEKEGYPFSVPVIKNLTELDLNYNLVIFVGDNGSGKSTLLETIAVKLGLNRIGKDTAYQDIEFFEIKRAINSFQIEYLLKPRGFFFRSEDFLSYIRFLDEAKAEAKKELKRIEMSYQNKSSYSQTLATMPHKRTLADIDNLYQKNLHEESHGESYLDFFKSRLRPNSLYLLDEAETPLSFQNQLTLILLMKEAIADGCQFIISTHSPVLMSYPLACIYDFNQERIIKAKYEDLEEVNQLRYFLNDKDSFLKHLFD
ncbi:MAG: AAA family ATPase [Bacilli bacterium]|nr:AAA family ATPase [Bacilli bacterium]